MKPTVIAALFLGLAIDHVQLTLIMVPDEFRQSAGLTGAMRALFYYFID